MSTTWFITGASRGLGRELTEQVLARGDRVAATLRTPSQLDDLVAVHGHRLWVRQLDVTDTMQMGRVVEEAFTVHERIDVVVSNAGFGVFGAAEDVTNDQVEQSENPPRRLLLGSDAYRLVTEALNERLATFERQRAVAFSTDVDQGEDAS